MATAERATKVDQIRELLSTEEGRGMTIAQIAEKVGGDPGHVARVRRSIESEPPRARMVPIEELQLDLGTQMRPDGATSEREIEFAEAMRNGDEFPPIQVIEAPEGLIPWDGFTRVGAALRADLEEIAAIVVPGTLDDAIMLSVRANEHGVLPRCPQTKRNAVMTVLRKYPDWSSERIAAAARVSPTFVNDTRAEFYAERKAEDDSFVPPAEVEGTNGRKYPHTPPPTKQERYAASKSNPRAGVRNRATPETPAETEEDHPFDAPVSTNGHVPESTPRAGDAPTKGPKDEPESDEEFLSRLYRDTGKEPVRDRLPPAKRRIFDAHALLYRDLMQSPTGLAFKRLANGLSKQKAVGGLRGGFMARVNRTILAPHPRDWVLCYACKGSGISDGVECPADGCRGNGFKLS